jgi:regulator of RNase E activity RraA
MTVLTAEIRSQLQAASTATLTTQLFSRGIRNAFLYGLRPLNAASCNLVAESFTLRYIPAREDIDVISVFEDPAHPQRRAIEEAPPGSVLVMDCRRDGRAASAGAILATRLAVRGVAGVVTDGSFRDSPEIANLGLPAFSAGVSATTNLALHHAVDLQVPIACAGVPIYPGDVLVGDPEGVVCIPRELVGEVALASAEQESLERFLQGRVAGGAALRGTYPPDAATRELYRDWRCADVPPVDM